MACREPVPAPPSAHVPECLESGASPSRSLNASTIFSWPSVRGGGRGRRLPRGSLPCARARRSGWLYRLCYEMIVRSAVAVLLAVLGSAVDAVATAVSSSIARATIEKARTVTCTTMDAPGFSELVVQFTVPVRDPDAGAVHDVPGDALTDWKEAFQRLSLTATLEAAPGPLFVTVTVNVTFVPSSTVPLVGLMVV